MNKTILTDLWSLLVPGPCGSAWLLLTLTSRAIVLDKGPSLQPLDF